MRRGSVRTFSCVIVCVLACEYVYVAYILHLYTRAHTADTVAEPQESEIADNLSNF